MSILLFCWSSCRCRVSFVLQFFGFDDREFFCCGGSCCNDFLFFCSVRESNFSVGFWILFEFLFGE